MLMGRWSVNMLMAVRMSVRGARMRMPRCLNIWLSDAMLTIMPRIVDMHRRREPREQPARKDHQNGKSAKHGIFRGEEHRVSKHVENLTRVRYLIQHFGCVTHKTFTIG